MSDGSETAAIINFPRLPANGGNGSNFLKALSRYYRDFLDSDFKRQRLPKRSITNKDRAGNLTGIPLRKYSTFQREVWRKLNQPIAGGIEFSIVRGRHRAHLSKIVIDIIEKHAATLDEETVASLRRAILIKAKDLAPVHKDDPETYRAQILEQIQSLSLRTIVRPLLSLLEGYFENVADKPVETIFEVEDELTDRLVADVEDAVGAALNTALVEGEFGEFEALLVSFLEVEVLQEKLKDFFSDFATGDLYSELHNLLNTLKLQENFETYLYVGEIRFKNHAYPLFYLPLMVERQETTFQVTADPHLYVNKKAVDFVAQELAREEEKSAISLVKDRILYLEDGMVFARHMQGLLDEWGSYFSLRDPVDLLQPREQTARSLNVLITNRLHLAAFDKSDESMLNDYETLLTLAEGGEDAAADFTALVMSFLRHDPVSVSTDVEKEWDETETENRLVYRSPIPLNEQQRNIASALRHPKCRFVAVQGPPGTGKSHTITALVFDAILTGRNVLVLSDKNEALEVVENMLSQTLSGVRLSKDFQNPILRLGRSTNTYAKILSGQSIERIKTHHKVAQANKKELQREIKNEEQDLKAKLRNTSDAYSGIEIGEVISFQKREANLAQTVEEPQRFVDDDVLGTAIDDLENLREVMRQNDERAAKMLRACGRKTLNDIENLLKVLPAVNNFECLPTDIPALRFFSSFAASEIDVLADFIRCYQSARWPVFGFLFSKSAARAIDADLGARLKCVTALDAHAKLETLVSGQHALSRLRSALEKEGVDLNFFDLAFQTVSNDFVLGKEESRRTEAAVSRLKSAMSCREEIGKYIGPEEDFLNTLTDDASEAAQRLERLIEYRSHHRRIKKAFDAVPEFDYLTEKGKLESLFTAQLANTIDTRVIDFHENKKTTAGSLRDIIRKKQRFPRDKFEDLKQAFPCIIANIRDYAEYVPLETGLFDLVIIDEASQVSIAQAFPAIIRAKKMVVLGDHNQFSNVKTTYASIAINNSYTNEIKKDFVAEFGDDADQLNRLSKFNIKTSILEFIEMIANYSTMLKIHFRGYPELISFSSKHFYGNTLQAVKIRGKPIDEVLKFSVIDHDGKKELKGNVNKLEAKEILAVLEGLADQKEPLSVGVITPFADQQRFLVSYVQQSNRGEELFSKLQLKIMTFDSCQGEERDVIIYSMVANPADNRLNAVFPKDLSRSEDVETILRLQRLNVGFSRSKETIHFILSLPVGEISGAVGTAIRHYETTLKEARDEPSANDVDPKSPMEAKLLNWLKHTDYYQEYRKIVEIIPQFPIGNYLRQLDPTYDHPRYRVDFLLRLKVGEKVHQLIIEYDGFAEHFTNLDEVDAANYRYYYRASDVEREKILESYGYRMLRVNRFNVGKDPVATLSERLYRLTKHLIAKVEPHELVKKNQEIIKGLESGQLKRCSRCGGIRRARAFEDKSLKSGIGRVCKTCKATKRETSYSRISARGHRKKKRQTASSRRSVPTCSRCGSRMIQRTGRHGEFWGCSRYPRCRGTRPLLKGFGVPHPG